MLSARRSVTNPDVQIIQQDEQKNNVKAFVVQILALLVNLMKDYKTNSQKISFK